MHIGHDIYTQTKHLRHGRRPHFSSRFFRQQTTKKARHRPPCTPVYSSVGEARLEEIPFFISTSPLDRLIQYMFKKRTYKYLYLGTSGLNPKKRKTLAMTLRPDTYRRKYPTTPSNQQLALTLRLSVCITCCWYRRSATPASQTPNKPTKYYYQVYYVYCTTTWASLPLPKHALRPHTIGEEQSPNQRPTVGDLWSSPCLGLQKETHPRPKEVDYAPPALSFTNTTIIVTRTNPTDTLHLRRYET
ncbi:unnamed protein product, partial [Ectocarpus sp. 8 AP-2014]